MASPLTSKLLQLQSSSVSSVTSSSSGLSFEIVRNQGKRQSLSGYSADRESEEGGEGESILSIDSDPLRQKRQRREVTSTEDNQAKQKRLREERYAAATARYDISRLATPASIPQIGKNTRFNGAINLTTVKHKYSSQLSSCSGKNHIATDSKELVSKHDSMTVFAATYTDMLEKCRSFYPQNLANSSDNHSDGSLEISSSNVGASYHKKQSEATTKFFPHPTRIDDILTPADQIDKKKELKFSSSLVMSLSEALSICNESRLVVKASSPYLIVHANAAFCRLTGIGAHSFLGQPLDAVLSLTNHQELSLASCVTVSEIGQSSILNVTIRKNERKHPKDSKIEGLSKCGMVVFPVFAEIAGFQDAQETKKSSHRTVGEFLPKNLNAGESKRCSVTHFAMNINEFQEDAELSAISSALESRQTGQVNIPRNEGTKNDKVGKTLRQHLSVVG